ncbi:lipoyl synthase [Sporolituus thermophilus]|uniref:Lipoyl synthase n=1 Tax=Sporolituus thermophilus DSM 23256 TaxID=1123285 RepID=A0A1G7L746_9FIRM|nr:lipoyl synthase [Sporolituus thermophilus]SDF45265.1 lipoic acid synthetase [Sporolituus thermophilus DSM 23256]
MTRLKFDLAQEAVSRPPWLTQHIDTGAFARVERLLAGLKLHTVCQSASCPNIGECFGQGTATFLILGSVCTRRCAFCAVPKGAPAAPDTAEPERIAKAVQVLGLRHAVITSVTRDDLADGGASQFAACIERIRAVCPSVTVEVLTPDFAGNWRAAAQVLAACPDVFNHNIETVPRLYDKVRPSADYRRSLALLRQAAAGGVGLVKSGVMVGLGETETEVLAVFADLAAAGVTAVTIGQYLRPSAAHLPVAEYIHPDKFAWYEQQARRAGFTAVAAGPLVRSSYHAAAMAGHEGK